jgi:hypothetical protein
MNHPLGRLCAESVGVVKPEDLLPTLHGTKQRTTWLCSINKIKYQLPTDRLKPSFIVKRLTA